MAPTVVGQRAFLVSLAEAGSPATLATLKARHKRERRSAGPRADPGGPLRHGLSGYGADWLRLLSGGLRRPAPGLRSAGRHAACGT
jgi:hypothetical protein